MSNFGPVHTLIVREVGEPYGPLSSSEFEDYEIIHPAECEHYRDDLCEVEIYTCGVGGQEPIAGVRFSLEYVGTPITEPGTYFIQAWAETIRYFEGTDYDGGIALANYQHYEFSNFRKLSRPLVYGDLQFWYIETFYQAMKSENPHFRERVSRMTPKEAKSAGQRPWQPQFDRIPVMQWAIEHVFVQGTPEADRLLASGDQELVEWNYWHDTFWGKCICAEHGSEGENHLGLLHMAQRARLREAV